ncbi:AAA family ATPase [Pseudonocardia bannensis]|uniref:AAA family ATPase n=1 Tax=Pseudonocardia bannensis TaxID=630973 RepID=A0A848DJL7_9PSEU|nr:AAA family ATPase [Pseudonocardia bannensis]NMH92888.1 AAA family ATPase [Pseudonocardia bannensis]
MPARRLDKDVMAYFEDAGRRLGNEASGARADVPRLELFRSDRVAFISRRYVAGQTLDEWLADPPTELSRFLDVAVVAVKNLCFLHSTGLTHGNVKASNLVVSAGHVALVDHGLARLSSIFDYKVQGAPTAMVIPSPESQAGDVSCLASLLLKAFERVLATGPPATTAFTQQLNLFVRMTLGRLAGLDGGYNVLTAAVRDLEELAEACRSGRLADVSIGSQDLRPELGPAAFAARPAEWSKLIAALGYAQAERTQTVLVEGPAGIGKTRLLQEFSRWAQAEHTARVIYVKSEPAVASRPHVVLSSFVEALQRSRGGEPGTRFDGDEEQQSAFADGTEGFGGGGDMRLQGALRPDEAARRLATSLSQLATAENPLLVIIDDCHFARREDILLLGHLADVAPKIGRGVVMIFVRRGAADPEDRMPAIETEHVVRVNSLPPDAVRSILTSMAGRVDDAVVDGVIRWAGGSPLMAQNAIRFLTDSGAVVPGPNGWESRGRLPAPPAVLTGRVRSLPSHLRSVLKVAAAIGFRGRMDILAGASGKSVAWCATVVSELARRGLLHEHRESQPRSRGPGIRDFVFAHDTVREEALADEAGVPLAEIHRQVARAMIALGHTDEFDLAFHLAASGDMAAAFPHAVTAARTARHRYSLGTAREYYELAIAVRETADLLREMGEVLMLDGCYAEAVATLKRSLSRCAHSDVVARAQIFRLLGETHFKTGSLEEAEQYFLQALQALGEPLPRDDRSFLLASVKEVARLSLGRHSPHQLHARDSEHPALKAAVFGNLAYCWWFHNSIRALWAQGREMAVARHCAVDGPERAHAYATHAVLCGALLGRARRAARYGARAVSIRKQAGDEWGEAHALHLYGVALVASGDYPRSIALLTAAVERFDRTADRWEAHTSRWHRAIALYRLGDREAAAREAELVHRLAEAIGDRQASVSATFIRALACDGEDVGEAAGADPGPDFDVQSTLTHLLARAIGLLGAHHLEEADDVLNHAATEIRRRRMVNSYVVPVLSWRATVARWRAEGSPPRSVESRRWAVRAAVRTVVAATASSVYQAEREHVRYEVKQWPSVIRHAFLSGSAR